MAESDGASRWPRRRTLLLPPPFPFSPSGRQHPPLICVYTCIYIYTSPAFSTLFPSKVVTSTPPRPTSTLSREFPINSLIKVDRLARRKEGWMWNMERSGSARNGTLDLLTAFSCSLCLFPASRRVTERPTPPRDLRLVAISE